MCSLQKVNVFVTYNPLPYLPLTRKIIIKQRGVSMITKQFGERIRELRNVKGLSQEKFALSIDMDRTYYASVESGKRNISINNIAKIAQGLGISLEELFKGL